MRCLRRLVTFRCTAWSMEIPKVACYGLMIYMFLCLYLLFFFTKEAELWLQLTWRWLAVPARIYMIGDNPAADVRGANSAGDPWRSILVCTGEVCFPKGDEKGMLSGRFWYFKNSQGWDWDFSAGGISVSSFPQKLFASCPEPNVFELFVSLGALEVSHLSSILL